MGQLKSILFRFKKDFLFEGRDMFWSEYSQATALSVYKFYSAIPPRDLKVFFTQVYRTFTQVLNHKLLLEYYS